MVFVNEPQNSFSLYWFSDDFRLIFTLQDFVGRMPKIEDRYCIETDSFVPSSIPNKSVTINGIKGTPFSYENSPHTQNSHNPSLSRFEDFPDSQTFCSKPGPLYTIQYSDLFVTCLGGLNMHTVQPNPRSVINEYVSGKIVLDTTKNKYVFPGVNVSNNFATIDFTLPLPTSTLPHYSTVKLISDEYPLKTTSANIGNESPAKVYSKTNYPVTPPSF